MNKSRLNSIKEELLSEKPKAAKNIIKDQDYQSANFRDYIKTDHHKLNNKFKQIQKKSYLDDKEINFLTKDATLLNLKEKQIEFSNAIINQNAKLQNIKSKYNQSIRNPNVQNLLIDIRTKSGVSQLQEDLKKEFDIFLNASFKFPTQNSMTTKPREWNYLTLMDYNEDDLFKTTTTTKNEIISIDKEILALNNNKHETKSSKSAKSAKSTKHPSSSNKKQINTNKNENVIKKEQENNMQVALIVDENTSKSKPLIELNKMLESIKRIDLPKFQPEILQICQYGNDAQLFSLYPEDLDYELNHKKNDLGRFSVHECCVKGNTKMLKGLLAYIDDINQVDLNNQTAAHIAAKYGELECLKILFSNGINLKLKDKFGMLVSHIAAQQNHVDIIEFFFEIGLNFNTGCNKGKLPIHYAAEYGAFESIQSLQKYYNDISVTDNDGNTAAHLAAMNDHLKCVKYLYSLGLPVDKVRNNLGRNVAHIACLNGCLKTLHWLLDNNADRFNIDNFGNTLSHSSCQGGTAECFHCCIQHDVPFDYINMFEETPLEVARKVGKSLSIEKAAQNLIRCKYCVENALKSKWQKENESIEESNKAFTAASGGTNAKSAKTITSMSAVKSARAVSSFTQPDRDFLAQYLLGPDI